MRRFPVLTVLAILLLCFSTLLNAASQDLKDNPSAPTIAAPSYPESQEGLKHLIEDIFGAIKSGDSAKASSYFSNLAIPDHSAWFMRMFGPLEGPRLEAKYEALLPQAPTKIRQAFGSALNGERTHVEIIVLQKRVDPIARLGHAVIEAMVQPIPLYVASGSSPKEKYSAYIGDFVFVDGGFRYLDTEVLQALSTAPPLRIRVGGNVQRAKIIREVSPIYPDEARTAHTEGAVVLHVVIGTDGAVRETSPVSGDPVLVKAAVDAVRQWQYQPTLLNNTPVEVDTTVTVDFHLNRR